MNYWKKMRKYITLCCVIGTIVIVIISVLFNKTKVQDEFIYFYNSYNLTSAINEDDYLNVNIYVNNTKLQLYNSTLKNSNNGIIAYCNSDVQYTGTTKILFNSIQVYKQNNELLSASFVPLTSHYIPILKSDYAKLSSHILNYNERGTYLTYQPIINYTAGNSRCNCFEDANHKFYNEQTS